MYPVQSEQVLIWSVENNSRMYNFYIFLEVRVREGRAGVDGKSFSKNGQMERQEDNGMENH